MATTSGPASTLLTSSCVTCAAERCWGGNGVMWSKAARTLVVTTSPLVLGIVLKGGGWQCCDVRLLQLG